MKTNIFLILLSLILYTNESFSQAACPDLTGFNDSHAYFEPYPYMQLADAEFKFLQISANSFDVKVDWSTLNLDSRYKFNIKNGKEMIIQAIIYQLLFNCPNPTTKTITFYEEKTCYMELKCYIKTFQTNSVLCYNSAWVGGEPEWFNYSGSKYYPKTQKVSCGTACCSTVYTLDCDEAEVSSIKRWSITSKVSTSTGCNTSTTLDCLTNEIIPCEVDCE